MKPSFYFGLLGRARQQIFQVAVLAVLLAIGVWGHKSHWQFSPHAEANVASHLPAVRAGQTGGALDPPAKATSSAGVDASAAAANKTDKPEGEPITIRFPTTAAAEQLGVKCAVAERRSMDRQVTAAGVVSYEPTRLAQLSARVSGTVWRAEKQVGQAIKAGDVLAIIDAPAVGQSKADFLHSIADVQLCEKACERFKAFANGEVPTRQIQEAETELRKARVDLFNAQQALISLGMAIDLDDWKDLSESELQHRIKFLGLPDAVVSQLDPNSTTATLLPLYAPFDGVVIGRDLAKGEVVSPGQHHFEIADVSKMWIVLSVREQDADDLELGQKVDFATGNVTVAGTISWMSTAVDEKSRTVEVRCETDNPEIVHADGRPTGKRLLRANLFGVGTIHVRENPQALAVPTKAVQRHGLSPLVFVEIDPQTFAARRVRVGVVTPNFTEIVAGLENSEPVVIEGSHILKAELQRLSSSQPP